MANTLNLGDGNWATKEDLLLGYNSENNNYKPLPFDFSRGSNATVINKDGLIETIGSGKARIDFKDDSKGALLLEPSRSNLIPYSEDFSKGDWNNQFGGVASAPIVTSNYSISPDGTLNADRIIFNLNGGTTVSDFSQITDRVTTIVGDTTHSVWIKSNTTSNYSMSFVDAFSSSTSIIVTPEWQRFDLTFTTATTYNDFKLRLRGSESTSDYADVSVWGAQIEQGSYATSYIPTQGSAVTRVADVCNNGANEQVINSSEGVLYAEIAALSNTADASKFISISDGTYNNRASILFSNGSTNQIRTFLRVGGVVQIDVYNNVTDVANFNKVAFSYKENDFKVYINGYLVSTDTSGSVWPSGTISKLSFSEINTSAGLFNGKAKEIRIYNTALSDSELQALTS